MKQYAIELATHRQAVAAAKEVVESTKKELEETPQWKAHQEALSQLSSMNEIASQSKTRLSEIALQAHAQDPEVKEFPGGKIINKKIRTYEEADAIAWAIEKNFPNLLKLNKTEFNKVSDTLTPDFVEVSFEAATRIDSNLDYLLEDKQDENQND